MLGGYAMRYAIIVLAVLGAQASPRPAAAVEVDIDLLDACKSGLACVTYYDGVGGWQS